MSTKKLFWDDPYQTECRAVVTGINGRKIKLNQTVFFAFSGGQESDEGTINSIKVLEAIKEGNKEDIVDIEYTLEEDPNFKVGDEVQVIIDKDKRSRLRRLHSAAHIVYYFVIKKLGNVKIVGSNVSSEKSRMDFGYYEPFHDKLPEIEKQVNDFIEEDHLITMKQDPEKVDLKWWTCGDWKMPCGGTHVKTTNEIGKLRLSRKNKGKGRERIEMYLNE